MAASRLMCMHSQGRVRKCEDRRNHLSPAMAQMAETKNTVFLSDMYEIHKAEVENMKERVELVQRYHAPETWKV